MKILTKYWLRVGFKGSKNHMFAVFEGEINNTSHPVVGSKVFLDKDKRFSDKRDILVVESNSELAQTTNCKSNFKPTITLESCDMWDIPTSQINSELGVYKEIKQVLLAETVPNLKEIGLHLIEGPVIEHCPLPKEKMGEKRWRSINFVLINTPVQPLMLRIMSFANYHNLKPGEFQIGHIDSLNAITVLYYAYKDLAEPQV